MGSFYVDDVPIPDITITQGNLDCLCKPSSPFPHISTPLFPGFSSFHRKYSNRREIAKCAGTYAAHSWIKDASNLETHGKEDRQVMASIGEVQADIACLPAWRYSVNPTTCANRAKEIVYLLFYTQTLL
jgi:hypothetical protein